MSTLDPRVQALLEQTRNLSTEERFKFLGRAQRELRRRDAIRAERGHDGLWRDRETLQPLTDADIVEREVAFEKTRPTTNDLTNKVVVDRKWLAAHVSDDELRTALLSGDLINLTEWL